MNANGNGVVLNLFNNLEAGQSTIHKVTQWLNNVITQLSGSSVSSTLDNIGKPLAAVAQSKEAIKSLIEAKANETNTAKAETIEKYSQGFVDNIVEPLQVAKDVINKIVTITKQWQSKISNASRSANTINTNIRNSAQPTKAETMGLIRKVLNHCKNKIESDIPLNNVEAMDLLRTSDLLKSNIPEDTLDALKEAIEGFNEQVLGTELGITEAPFPTSKAMLISKLLYNGEFIAKAEKTIKDEYIRLLKSKAHPSKQSHDFKLSILQQRKLNKVLKSLEDNILKLNKVIKSLRKENKELIELYNKASDIQNKGAKNNQILNPYNAGCFDSDSIEGTYN